MMFSLWKRQNKQPKQPPIQRRFCPRLEILEDRALPALLASQVPLNLPTISMADVTAFLDRAAAATSSDNAIVAVVDREGNILGVRVEGNVDPAITGDPNLLDFSIDGAVSEARSAAFFSSDADPLTSRTVQFISQSTVTQREVDSYTYISDPNSTVGGPGLVAPIGVGGHFPPNVDFTPTVDLFGIENTNRDMLVNSTTGILATPGGGGSTADQVGLSGRFNIDPAFVPAGQSLVAPLSYYDTLLAPGAAGQADPNIDHVASRGVGTLPGGIPLYKDGVLVGAIGVFFPGKTGFASEENSSLSSDYDPSKPDLSMEAEFIALAAAGGSSQAGFPIGTLGGVAAPAGYDLPFPRIDLAGVTLDTVGPGGLNGPQNLVDYVNSHFSVGTGDINSGTNEKVDFLGDTILAGTTPPQGWLVTPHAGGNLTAAQVTQMIDQGIAQAQQTRAQIRPLGSTTEMVFAVTDSAGDILGLYRMPDAPIFSIDVAVSKARDAAYYDDASQNTAPVDQLPGIPAGTAFTARTFRYLALPNFPEGITGDPPGPWSILNDGGVDNNTGLNVGAPQPIASYTSVFGYDAFHPNTTFQMSGANSSGVVFFPGSSGVYLGGIISGGFGVSGDGVLQDDVVTAFGIAGFEPPNKLRADQFKLNGIRLPYQNFSRNSDQV
jgi:uncharacterized protein GlcG (DUF336 family)